jgi:hypothetical protein
LEGLVTGNKWRDVGGLGYWEQMERWWRACLLGTNGEMLEGLLTGNKWRDVGGLAYSEQMELISFLKTSVFNFLLALLRFRSTDS